MDTPGAFIGKLEFKDISEVQFRLFKKKMFLMKHLISFDII